MEEKEAIKGKLLELQNQAKFHMSLIVFLTVLLFSLMGLLCFKGAFYQADSFAVVNLNQVMQENELRLAQRQLTSEQITQEAAHFATRLQKDLEKIRAEHQVTLLVSNAVIAPHDFPDLTEALLSEMGLKSFGQEGFSSNGLKVLP